MTGLDMPVSEAVNYSNLWETTLNPWVVKVSGWEEDPQVVADAQSAAHAFFRMKFYPTGGGRRGLTNPSGTAPRAQP